MKKINKIQDDAQSLQMAVSDSCGSLTITCEDNMELMARYPDNYFDLAIVDPEYGIGADKKNAHSSIRDNSKYGEKNWDSKIPSKDYFNELFRVSKNQVIWGGNYFIEYLKNTQCMIVWNKPERNFSLADAEIAWTSFNGSIRTFDGGRVHYNRIHPTQKPTKLYKWILDKYAKEGDKILDTHLGSGSIAIACHDYGFDLTACELDKEYFDKAMQRINNHVAQQKLF